MADETEKQEPIASEKKVPEAEGITPRRKLKPFKIKDREQLAQKIVDEVIRDLNDRQDRINMRKDRYAKLRGWLPNKSFPWENCANFWLPIILTYTLRTKSTLENAIKSQRPAMEAKALHRTNRGKEPKVNQLLDFQFFNENEGEKVIDSYLSNFVNDEAVFSLVHWVRREDNYRDIRVLRPLEPELDPLPQLIAYLPIIFPNLDKEHGTRMTDDEGWDWEVEYFETGTEERKKVRVEFYERDDGQIEAHVAYKATVHDGPVIEVLDFEDVVFPVRSGNLQPPETENPYGAPHVNLIRKLSLDAIKRGMEDGTYPFITDEDWNKIQAGKSATGSGRPEEQPKEQKDQLEGVTPHFGSESVPDRQILESYRREDADGDGLEEDVIIWVERDSQVLMKAAFLTQMYPGLPIRRPLNSESFIPEPNRIYGMSLAEMLESTQDLMQMLMNQHIDWGTIVNVPFFFYRASSGMKPEVIHMEPGEGYPLDDPSSDVHFPTFAQRGDAYTINTMTLLQQFAERLAMIGDVQFGRVPTGKASALRTMGTTMSLIAQGDVRSEQVLRRAFHGLAAIYSAMHRLNKRYLPEKKEIRLAGVSEQGQDPYTEVSRDEINYDVDFEFKATMLNTNKQLLGQTLTEVIAMLVSPLAVQAGIVSESEIYDLFRDKLKAADLDPDRYLVRPPQYGQSVTAEEVIAALINRGWADGVPEAKPLEPPEEHMQKLAAWEATDTFGLLNPQDIPLYKVWKQRVMAIIMRRQQMMHAAMAMQGGGSAGPGGVPTTAQPGATTENPPVESGEMIDESIGRVQ